MRSSTRRIGNNSKKRAKQPRSRRADLDCREADSHDRLKGVNSSHSRVNCRRLAVRANQWEQKGHSVTTLHGRSPLPRFLGGPVAGGFLSYKDHVRFGNPRKAKTALLISCAI